MQRGTFLFLFVFLLFFVITGGHGGEEDEEEFAGDEGHLEERVKRGVDDSTSSKTKGRKKDAKKKRVTLSEIKEVVREEMQRELSPLNAALKLIRLDAFTEGVQRQLSTLEHIQSKLLKEYGELRAAVTEVGRNTLDLAKQVATLDERLSTLDRNLPYTFNRMNAKFELREKSTASANPDVAELMDSVKDAVTSVSSRIDTAEKHFKENLSILENRTTEALRRVHQNLDRRLSVAAFDTELIIGSLESRSHPVSSLADPSVPRQFGIQKGVPPRDTLVYLPADNTKQVFVESASDESKKEGIATSTPRVTQWPWTVTEIHNLNFGSASKLASEIARHLLDEENKQPIDCSAISLLGEKENGVYTIYPPSCSKKRNVQVWCELKDAGGGWTIIQRRGSRSPEVHYPFVDFFKDWVEYKWGFGNLEGEYWLGNEFIHQMTTSGDYVLRVDLLDWSNESRWAEYKHFHIENENKNYSLHIGDYKGNAGNSLKNHQKALFSTKDRDNDSNPRVHCARTFHGGWWFTACHESHLNGRFYHRHHTYGDGINWHAFRGPNYSLKFSRMMIRPSSFAN